MITIITKTFNIYNFIKAFYKEFLVKYPETNKVKIEVKFYDKEGCLIKPFFYFRTKNFKLKKAFLKSFKSSYLLFKNKNVNSEIEKYEINIFQI